MHIVLSINYIVQVYKQMDYEFFLHYLSGMVINSEFIETFL